MTTSTAICEPFWVGGPLVPWSAPEFGAGPVRTMKDGKRRRIPKKNPRLKAFQGEIALRARVAMGGMKPFDGPVGLILKLRKSAGRKHRPGDWWAEVPDLTNLLKGIEDAIKGIIFVDDRQVCRVRVDKRYAIGDGVGIKVVALGERP